MNHASLFSGIGGFDLAAEMVGWKNLFNCEIDPFCRQVLNYHFPNAKGYTNIKTADFREWNGKVDVLSGGFPCQPFSMAGLRRGADDDRYLWPEMLRAIEECQPTWIVGENVAGLLSMVQPCKKTEMETNTNIFGETFAYEKEYAEYVLYSILQDLTDRGYSIQPYIIPACAVGAPHRRDRIWIVAHRINTTKDGRKQSGVNSTSNTSSDRWSQGGGRR